MALMIEVMRALAALSYLTQVCISNPHNLNACITYYPGYVINTVLNRPT